MVEKTLIVDIQESVLKEILKGERVFPTTIYFRKDGEKASFVIEHEKDFVEVEATFKLKNHHSGCFKKGHVPWNKGLGAIRRIPKKVLTESK